MEAQGTITRDTVGAGFGERFVAYLIDSIIVGVAYFIVFVLTNQVIGLLAALIIGVGYYVYFWTNSGQTPGKMAMGLKVVSADGGGLLDVGGALIRYVGYIVSGIPIYLGFFWVLWDPKHEDWADKIATTKVIKVQK